MKKFLITLTEVKKYNPMNRILEVTTKDAFTTQELMLARFGRSKVRIDKVEEITE